METENIITILLSGILSMVIGIIYAVIKDYKEKHKDDILIKIKE